MDSVLELCLMALDMRVSGKTLFLYLVSSTTLMVHSNTKALGKTINSKMVLLTSNPKSFMMEIGKMTNHTGKEPSFGRMA
jgi:hypothetical protein